MKACPALGAQPSWHFSPRCIPFKGQDFKECAFQPLARAHTGKAEQKEPRVQRDVFFSLLSDAFQALLMGSSFLAPFPDRGAWLEVCRGERSGKEVKGNAFGSSSHGDFEQWHLSRFIMSLDIKGCRLPGLRMPSLFPLLCKRLKSEQCSRWTGRYLLTRSFLYETPLETFSLPFTHKRNSIYASPGTTPLVQSNRLRCSDHGLPGLAVLSHAFFLGGKRRKWTAS